MKEKIYLKSKNTGLVVELYDESENTFSGVVAEDGVNENRAYQSGHYSSTWLKDVFNVVPYTPIQKDRIVISHSKNFICISVCRDNDEVMSWEYLQGIKDKYYPNLEFMEVYPCRDEVINKANERHLVHQIGLTLPNMGDLEEPAEVEVIE